jgi:hypothetical protein
MPEQQLRPALPRPYPGAMSLTGALWLGDLNGSNASHYPAVTSWALVSTCSVILQAFR